MTPTEGARFLISEYGLTRREALFTPKLVRASRSVLLVKKAP